MEEKTRAHLPLFSVWLQQASRSDIRLFLPVILHILVMACPAFLICYLIARTLSRFRLTRRVVM